MPDQADDAVEERAAIMEHDGGLSREAAEDAAAKLHGYQGWHDYQRRKRK